MGRPVVIEVLPRERDKVKERFLSKVARNGSTKCWEWTSAVSKTGYGMFRHHRTVYSHRMAWVLWKGKISENKRVFRSCENKLCVNPEHLYLSSVSEYYAKLNKDNEELRKKYEVLFQALLHVVECSREAGCLKCEDAKVVLWREQAKGLD